MTIAEQLHQVGVIITPIYDGVPHQIEDPKGWYIAHRHQVNGESCSVLILGLWKSDQRYTFKEGVDKLKGKHATEFEKLTRLQSELERAYRLDINEKTKPKAKEIVALAKPLMGNNGYLSRKKALVQGFLHDPETTETLIIPMRDIDGEVWSVQKIYFSGEKEFLSGGRVQGTMFTFGTLEHAAKVYLCEGVATGASIFLATDTPTVCAFNASNLIEVAKLIKRKHPLIQLVICGDDDHENERNIGKEKAYLAAKHTRSNFVLPVFIDATGRSDFNDLYVVEGLEQVRHQIESKEGNHEYVLPLGYQNATYYYTSSSNPQIIKLQDHSETDLYQLMPRDYWIDMYGGRMSKDGEYVLRMPEIKSDLMNKSRARGFFKAERVRGLGVWQDKGQTVVHLGNKLNINQKQVSLMALGEDNIYEFSEAQKALSVAATLEELTPIREILRLLHFTGPRHGEYLGGWLVGSLICGSLEWRSHINITGEAGAGKSTVLDSFIRPLLSGYKTIQVRGATTEAGLRQTLKSHAIPVIFDEFECESARSEGRIKAITELFRQASSEQGGGILKGSASGEATEYQARFMGIVSGIQPQITAGADKARFTQIELKKVTENADKQWEEISAKLHDISPELAGKFFARCVVMLPTIKKNIKIVQLILAKQQNQRFGQQYGTLLGCYYALISDDVITYEQAEELVRGVVDEEVTNGDKGDTDHDECLTHLLESVIRYTDTEGKTIEAKLEVVLDYPDGLKSADQHPNREALRTKGIYTTSKDGAFGFVVASTDPELKKVFKDTKWSNNWNAALVRVKGNSKHRVRSGSGNRFVRGVFVPVGKSNEKAAF